MPSKRRFYRTIYKFEMLTEDPPHMLNVDGSPLDLSDIHYHTTEGHASGAFVYSMTEEISPFVAAQALLEHGSDTEFFCLTPDGEDTEDAWSYEL